MEIDLRPDARWEPLAVDETALPAIAGFPDAAPRSVVIEAATMDDAQPLRRSATTELHRTAQEASRCSPRSVREHKLPGQADKGS